MKRILGMVLVMGMLASVAMAATNVTSVNGVGYYTKTLEAGNLYLMGIQLDDMHSGTITDVLGTDVASGTIVTFWDPIGQTWGATETFATFPTPGWVPGTNVLTVGMGMFIKSPSEFDLTILGEIPLDDTNSVSLYSGLSFVSAPYPVDMVITNAGFAPTSGDLLTKWNDMTQGWGATETYATFPTPGWVPGTNTFDVGEAVVYKSQAGGVTSWDVERPFDWAE